MRSSVLCVGETRQYVAKSRTGWIYCEARDSFRVTVLEYSLSRKGRKILDRDVGSYTAAVKLLAKYISTGVSTKFIVGQLPLGGVGEERAAPPTLVRHDH